MCCVVKVILPNMDRSCIRLLEIEKNLLKMSYLTKLVNLLYQVSSVRLLSEYYYKLKGRWYAMLVGT